MKVKLYAHEVAPKNLAHEANIPDYVTGPPDMIVWGNRTFKQAREAYSAEPKVRDGEADYVECFTHVIVD